MSAPLNAERQRLENQRNGSADWRLWGPYLAERAWGTVREDYSADGRAWDYLSHDDARSRAYRWSEDGLGGISDAQQRLCFALALWNGRDPILKERAFGLNGNEGNHGEDVKECYFYLDALPSHAWLRYLYKYPQAAFPYDDLVAENARRSRLDPPYGLLDTGVFAESRYWDVEVCYAKANPTEIHIRITVSNRGPDSATLHLLPQLWFRNTWDWDAGTERPSLRVAAAPVDGHWAVRAAHPSLGSYHLYGQHAAQLLFTENSSNTERLWGTANATLYVKDAFHRYLVDGDTAAVNPAQTGSKCAALHHLTLAAGHSAHIDMTLSADALAAPFAQRERRFSQRQSEATEFFHTLLPDAAPQDHRIMRQALSGMIWNKQFFHYDVARWLDGDGGVPSPHPHGRNRHWRHFKAADIISMPDSWEYPWFAAWDLAFHSAALALVDVDFAKQQIEVLLGETYLHPDGQIPAYEWAFDDTNPPVHAMGALKLFRAERVQRGAGDTAFLKRVLHKLLLNYAWWINRKDSDGNNVFEGGFLGLDNVSVYDRSQPLPAGFALKQADATGWMAMFSLNLTVIALEIATEDASFEAIAIQCYSEFLAIANAISGYIGSSESLWDEADGFYKDLVVSPDGSEHRIDVFSCVGLIPLFAAEVLDQRLLKHVPRFAAILNQHAGGQFDGHAICACPATLNERGEHLLALVSADKLPRILQRLLDSEQFLSPYGVRSVSKLHATRQHLGELPGIGAAIMTYEPGESTTALFGGNSNWRGPVWLPTNYLLVQALEKYQRYLGDGFSLTLPALSADSLHLRDIATLIAERLVDIFRRNETGLIPAFATDSPHQHDPYWQDLLLFHEYFHGETGQGLGAAHQTGWSALVANLVFRRYRQDIPEFWQRQRTGAAGSRVKSWLKKMGM